MNTFQAMLTKPISYRSFEGIKRTLPIGQLVEVVQIKIMLYSTGVNGKPQVERPGSFVGNLGADSFDLASHEFKTVD